MAHSFRLDINWDFVVADAHDQLNRKVEISVSLVAPKIFALRASFGPPITAVVILYTQAESVLR